MTGPYRCGPDGCKQKLLTIDTQGEGECITRHERDGSLAADYHHDLAVHAARQRGESVPRWLGVRHHFHLSDGLTIGVWCPFHGRWTIDTAELAAVMLEATASHRKHLKLKGTEAQPLIRA